MQKNTKIILFAALGVAAVAGAYMYLKPKKDEQKSGFWGRMRKEPDVIPRGVRPTFRDTGDYCVNSQGHDSTWQGTGGNAGYCRDTATTLL